MSPGLDPRPDVLVVHEDPAALIMKLAKLADVPASTELPGAQADDVVVISRERIGLTQHCGSMETAWCTHHRSQGLSLRNGIPARPEEGSRELEEG